MALRSGALLVCAAVSLAFGAFGCSAAEDGSDDAAAGDEAHFTVSNGHKFIVSATPEHVVFRKSVNGTAFPFDVDSLKDKAILIHPISGKAEDGVYSHVKSVEDDGDNYVVEATPLTFAEMEKITEDDIVRIYLDPKHSSNSALSASSASSAASDTSTSPESFGQLFLTPSGFDFGAATSVHPLGLVSGIPFGVFGSDDALNKTIGGLNPGVEFNQKIEKASFKPEVLFNWSKDSGLEMGFRTELDWKSRATITGSLQGEFYRSQAYEAFGAWVWVPLGIAPIPIKAGVRLRVSCQAKLEGPVKMSLDVSAHAKVGGSVRVRPSKDKALSEWVTEGSWPREVTGSADVSAPSFEASLDGSLWCALPRIELHTEIFGVVGPVAVMAPTMLIDNDGVHPEVRFSAGVTASLLGIAKETGVEVPVYTLKL